MAWTRLLTYTWEQVEYDEEAHAYRTTAGTPLVSASQFAAGEPFDSQNIARAVARKYGADPAAVLDMWDRNGKVSRTFGSALHLAMEQWFRHRRSLPAKGYHIPKPAFLRDAIHTFPLRDAEVLPEVLVSAVDLGMVGRVDGLVEISPRTFDIIDYKSDFDAEKNAEHHEKQLNFYRTILEHKGFRVRNLVIWSYTGAWVPFYVRRVNIGEV